MNWKKDYSEMKHLIKQSREMDSVHDRKILSNQCCQICVAGGEAGGKQWGWDPEKLVHHAKECVTLFK